jgi:SAM-dependent methyltransferase
MVYIGSPSQNATDFLEELPACPICHHPSHDAVLHYRFHGKYPLVICPNPACRTEYLVQRETAEALAQQYSDKAYYQSEDGIHGYFDYQAEQRAIMATTKRRLKLLSLNPGGPKANKLLEIGGAFGYASYQATRMGYDVRMVEISRVAREQAAKLNILSYAPSILHLLRSESFDVIMAWDALEHIYNLPSVIDDVYRVLKPGGTFFFNVPDTHSKSARLLGRHWWAYREPEHIIYLTPQSVSLLLRPERFDIGKPIPDKQVMTLGGAALRFGRLMPRWLAPTMGLTSFRILRTLRLANVTIPIPHGLRLYIAKKL